MAIKNGSTAFLKLILCLLALGAVVLCVIALPSALGAGRAGNYRPLLFAMYATAIPFFIALKNGLRLLNLIDASMAFSKDSVTSLGYIKYMALAVSLLYALDLPFIYLVDHQAGVPGRLLLGAVLTGAAFVVAVFAAVLEKLLQKGLELKSENDLTV